MTQAVCYVRGLAFIHKHVSSTVNTPSGRYVSFGHLTDTVLVEASSARNLFFPAAHPGEHL